VSHIILELIKFVSREDFHKISEVLEIAENY